MKNMKKIRYIVTFVFAITSFIVTHAINHVEQISEYVFPANIPNSPNEYTYMPDGLSYLSLGNDGKSIIKYDTKTGKEIEVVFDGEKSRENKLNRIDGFKLSADGSKMLIYCNKKMIYRRSFDAEYYVYEISRNILSRLSDNFARQQAPMFSPDARMVAFVAENNIYIKKLDYKTEVAVTKDGKKNEIINGVPDWTYEEEFTTDVSMSWSPDNMALCFIKYNEKDVKTYSFPLYKGACSPNVNYEYYPGNFTYKYPVAGEVNSKVSVYSYDVETRKLKNIPLAEDVEYIPRIAYAYSPDRLLVTTLNRAQNRMEIFSVNPKSTVVKSVFVEESSSWITPETYETLKYYPEYFVITSDKSGYSHIYQYTYAGNQMRQITSGDFEVTDFYGIDAIGNAYFQSTITGAINRVVSKIDKKGRITHLSPKEGMSSAVFAPTMDFYVLNHNNVTTPPVYKLYSNNGKELRVMVDNSAYAEKYRSIPTKEFFTFSNDGITLNGYVLKPLDFNPSKKYPVIMSQYSGPGSQEVLNRWRVDWDCYFAQQGYIVMCVDGRGTGGRGKAFESIVYKRLGYYETIDQIAAANYAASLPYVDANRIGIYGWSYGGYETLMAISDKESPYAAAVAVAPVTDWRYYDSVYAERYMLTPKENETGYNWGSPIKRTTDVKCRLLLMSGTADDNVHVQNTIEYVSELQSNGILCDMLLFPNMNHSIYHCNSRALVYAKMLDYFNRNM